MKALKLKGLSGSDLTKNKNYKYFLKFVEKAERIRLNKYDVPSLESVGHARGPHLNRIKKTDELKIYKRYVNVYDDAIFDNLKGGYNPPPLMVSRGDSDAEMTARVRIMAESKRTEAYAKLALGMTVHCKPAVTLKGDVLKKHEDYGCFDLFLKETAKETAREKKKE